MILPDLLRESAKRRPNASAVSCGEDALTYAELDALACQIAHFFRESGVAKGDRVGFWLPKSPLVVAVMQGALKAGAVYVPLDPLNPVARIETVVRNCSMRALVTTEARLASFTPDALQGVVCLLLDGERGGHPWSKLAGYPTTWEPDVVPEEDDLAYILYTSGSTGVPKGVCISHRNALAFVTWAADVIAAAPGDRFSNHAPFHFDLSVLDIYCALLVGAEVMLIPESMSYVPSALVEFLLTRRPTVWYSVPTALIRMMDEPAFPTGHATDLRTVVFAGEPFPPKHLVRLRKALPDVQLLNFYGPTETNVCTYYEVTDVSEEDPQPVPIGKACSGDEAWAVTDTGARAEPGMEGELFVSGPTVMLGYYGQPPQGDKPYPTGDIVRLMDDGNFVYVGRRDHMVKVRGHRVELGEIESALDSHPDIREVAVVVSGTGDEAKLVAAIVPQDARPSLLSLKKHCSERLPRYMIIDRVRIFASALPRTRNGKVDRRAIAAELDSDNS